MQQATQVKESDIFQKIPKQIAPFDLEKTAMKIGSFNQTIELSHAEMRVMRADGFKLQQMIDESAQWQKDLLALLKVDRILPPESNNSIKDSLAYFVDALRYSDSHEGYVELWRSWKEDNNNGDSSGMENVASLQLDLAHFLGNRPRVQWSVKQLRDLKSNLVDVLAAGEMIKTIEGCYFVGFSKFKKVGVYDSTGKFLEVRDVEMEEADNTFYHSGNKFLLD